MEAMFAKGMPEISEDGSSVAVSQEITVIDDQGQCQMLRLFQGSLEGLIVVLQGWSTKRLAEELPKLCAIVDNIFAAVVVFEPVRSMDCVDAWGDVCEEWNDSPSVVTSEVGGIELPEECERWEMPCEDAMQDFEKVVGSL